MKKGKRIRRLEERVAWLEAWVARQPQWSYTDSPPGDLLLTVETDLLDKNKVLREACEATCAAVEFRGKAGMSTFGELLPDESNWREGVEPYLLDLYERVRVVLGDEEATSFHAPVTPERCACGRELVCPKQYEVNKWLEERDKNAKNTEG